MKLLITESQKERIALNWMNKNFSPDLLEVVEKPNNQIFYKKDGEVVIEQDKTNKTVWIHYDNIWTFLRNVFSMEDNEIRSLLETWVEKTLNLDGYSVFTGNFIAKYWWEGTGIFD